MPTCRKRKMDLSPPPPGRKWEMRADSCLVLGFVFQSCWHICIDVAGLFPLKAGG